MSSVSSVRAVVDGHNDLAWEMREVGYDFDRRDIAVAQPDLDTDLPRMRTGGLAAQFWSVFVPCGLTGADAVTATLEQIDAVYQMIERYPDDLALVTSADGLRASLAHYAETGGAGPIASLMGAEGGHSIDNSLGTLRSLYRLGVRYLTLTHNENTAWADSATDRPGVGGLSAFGRAVVAEMNRLGMMVDLSHVATSTMHAALDVTRSPVIFSHSSARAVCDHPRNVPDDVLSRLAENGGLCMITFVPSFVSPQVRQWHLGVQQAATEAGVDDRDLSAMARIHPELSDSAAAGRPGGRGRALRACPRGRRHRSHRSGRRLRRRRASCPKGWRTSPAIRTCWTPWPSGAGATRTWPSWATTTSAGSSAPVEDRAVELRRLGIPFAREPRPRSRSVQRCQAPDDEQGGRGR